MADEYSTADESTPHDRELTDEVAGVLPKPQVHIIVDGNSIYKPGMKTVFAETDGIVEEVSGSCPTDSESFCQCDVVYTKKLVPSLGVVCTCEAYTPCSCEDHCTCQNVDSCPYYSAAAPLNPLCPTDGGCPTYSAPAPGSGGYTGGGSICTCEAVSCNGPCACVPVH